MMICELIAKDTACKIKNEVILINGYMFEESFTYKVL